ncbi:MAG TPA: hypothetical protein VJH67_02815 [Candidatus Paceibacterota bacterium]
MILRVGSVVKFVYNPRNGERITDVHLDGENVELSYGTQLHFHNGLDVRQPGVGSSKMWVPIPENLRKVTYTKKDDQVGFIPIEEPGTFFPVLKIAGGLATIISLPE